MIRAKYFIQCDGCKCLLFENSQIAFGKMWNWDEERHLCPNCREPKEAA